MNNEDENRVVAVDVIAGEYVWSGVRQQSGNVDLVMSTLCAVGALWTTHALEALAVTAPAVAVLAGGDVGNVEIAGQRAVEDAEAVRVAVSTAHFTRRAAVSTLGALDGTLLAAGILAPPTTHQQPASSFINTTI